MDRMWEALTSEFGDLPSIETTTRLVVRLLVAALLGGVLGYERERKGKSAGVRTHVTLAMGTAFFVLIPELHGMRDDALSRILQGILTGVGFLGAGTILKHADDGRIEGLTTSAGLWFTAAIGVAVGLGRELSAVVATLLVLFLLLFVPHVPNLSRKRKRFSLKLEEPRSRGTVR